MQKTHTAFGPEQFGCRDTVASMLLMDLLTVNATRAISQHDVGNSIATDLPDYFHQAVVFKITVVDHLDSGTSIGTLAVKVVDNMIVNWGLE
ncbi:uncharacterized protein N7487_007033 [Penicillium crustosum]|uniref:uncharacterized protein n=1 Tax=Penicillium crustosum TaxID=36656 RepID=UPI002389D7B6|nr:uncharacterized protein N7487_007033 [Penicillium crustosum]KAJ5412674.1 hypothetical protein N7487_007033 [Penicillium crustosum]